MTLHGKMSFSIGHKTKCASTRKKIRNNNVDFSAETRLHCMVPLTQANDAHASSSIMISRFCHHHHDQAEIDGPRLDRGEERKRIEEEEEEEERVQIALGSNSSPQCIRAVGVAIHEKEEEERDAAAVTGSLPQDVAWVPTGSPDARIYNH
jgi:hypothetical protein